MRLQHSGSRDRLPVSSSKGVARVTLPLYHKDALPTSSARLFHAYTWHLNRHSTPMDISDWILDEHFPAVSQDAYADFLLP